MSYTKDQLIKKLGNCYDRLEVIEVPVDEIEEGLKFRLKELDGGLMDAWQKCFEEIAEDRSLEAKYGSPSRLIIALSLVDQGDSRVFAPFDFKSHKVLDSIPASVRDRLSYKAYELSKMRNEDRETLAKNSETTPEKGSGST